MEDCTIKGKTIIITDDNMFKDLYTKSDKYNLIEFEPIEIVWENNTPIDKFGNIISK